MQLSTILGRLIIINGLETYARLHIFDINSCFTVMSSLLFTTLFTIFLILCFQLVLFSIHIIMLQHVYTYYVHAPFIHFTHSLGYFLMTQYLRIQIRGCFILLIRCFMRIIRIMRSPKFLSVYQIFLPSFYFYYFF